jgi:hypothetical protein
MESVRDGEAKASIMMTKLEAQWHATRSELKAIECRAIAEDYRGTETAAAMERIAQDYERRAKLYRAVFDLDHLRHR